MKKNQKPVVSFNQNDVNTKDIIAMTHKIIAYFAFAFKTSKARILY